MRVLELQAIEGPDGFAVAERPNPKGEGKVVIDVRAAGVGFPDLLISRGRYQIRPDLPFVGGEDVAGFVRSAPEGTRVRTGDRVWAWVAAGGHAELVAAPPDKVFQLPDDLSFEEGASLGSNFLTALFALRRRGKLKSGETMLVLGAGGGLGTAVVAVGKTLGARVIANVSSEEKAKAARDAGADEIAVGVDFGDTVRELTGGRGVDVVADIVGGDQNLQAIRNTAPEGRVLILGFTSGSIPQIAANRLLLRNVNVVGVGLGAFISAEQSIFTTTAKELTELIDSGLRPIVGRTFPLEQGSEAVRQLENRTARGKTVLTIKS
jgi:NADPH:quinone reductase